MDGSAPAPAALAWPDAIFAELQRWGVRQVAYVPDGGHARLIRAVHAEPTMRAIPLTTEEEGIAVLSSPLTAFELSGVLYESGVRA